MDKSMKLLIIVIIILVGVLGLVSGILITNFQKNTTNTTTVNNSSQLPVNNTTTTESSNESKSQEPTGITEGQAVQIALDNVGPINQEYYTQTTFSTGVPHKWHVDFYNKKTNKHIVGVSLNAITGEVRAIYH